MSRHVRSLPRRRRCVRGVMIVRGIPCHLRPLSISLARAAVIVLRILCHRAIPSDRGRRGRGRMVAGDGSGREVWLVRTVRTGRIHPVMIMVVVVGGRRVISPFYLLLSVPRPVPIRPSYSWSSSDLRDGHSRSRHVRVPPSISMSVGHPRILGLSLLWIACIGVVHPVGHGCLALALALETASLPEYCDPPARGARGARLSAIT